MLLLLFPHRCRRQILGTPGPTLDLSAPYPPYPAVQRKRFLAQSRGTSYVYDLPAMFHKSVARAWSRAGATPPASPLVVAKELVVDASGNLVETERGAGENTVGMVAWRLRALTPEYPHGRELVVIANDITVDAGSFSVDEDLLFFKGTPLLHTLDHALLTSDYCLTLSDSSSLKL